MKPGDRVLYTKPDDSGDVYKGTVIGFTPSLRYYHVSLDGYEGIHRLAAGTLSLLFETEEDVTERIVQKAVNRFYSRAEFSSSPSAEPSLLANVIREAIAESRR